MNCDPTHKGGGDPSQQETEPIEQIAALWEELSGYALWQNGLKALENYLELLDYGTVEEAVVASAERPDSRINCFRYCCGILRNKLAEKMDPSIAPPWKR